MASTTSVADMLGTSMQTVSSDMMSAIGTVLPIALGIGGSVLVIFLGWKIFKKLTK